MPQNLDYELYFNIAFFAIIGLGFIFGYIRGLRKSLYALVVTVLFYAIFFLTIDQVVNQLWVLPIPFLFTQLSSFLPELANVQTIGDGVFIMLESNLPANMTATMTNVQFVAFVTGIAMFVVKLVYTILYFTVGQLIFKFVFLIIRLMFFSKNQAMDDYKFAKRQVRKMKLKNRDIKRMKKEVRMEYKKMSRKEKRELAKIERKKKHKKRSKKDMFDNRELTQHLNKPSRSPWLGSLAGAAKGTVSAFITLILLGGMLNMMDSIMQVIPEDNATVSRETIELIYLSNTPVDTRIKPVQLASPFEVPAELETQLTEARNMLAAFNANVFVTTASQITYTNENYAGSIPLHLYLFDSVLSFNYDDEQIMLRNELDVISDTASILLDSAYFETNNISDITSAEIIELFNTISHSKLITTMLPLGIEVGSEMFDTPIEVPVDELYAIDWEAELQTLGSVVAVGFSLVNAAGILNDETDLTTVTLDGAEVKGLFDSLADSELATLGAYVAITPLLEQAGTDISSIITVPADIVWADEFEAFGLVAEAVLNTDITMSDLQSGDPTILLAALSDLDFTVLLNSEIVTNALINILSGDAGITGLDMIIIPDGIVWLDVFDENGLLVSSGELFNILTAINEITTVAAGFDFNNISLDVIADFDDATIDALFDSQILVASISTFILDMDLGTTPLIIPDSALDAEGNITSVELKAVANSARVLLSDLACDEGDTVCEDTGFDISKAFSLSDTSIDTLTSSDILGATIGNLILDQGGSILTVPTSALRTISVNSVNQDVVSNEEIKNLFLAVGVLGFTDLENMTFDASIINNLSMVNEPLDLDVSKTNTLFASGIVHATLSTMLFEQTEGLEGVLAVPYFAENGTTAIRETDPTDGIEYISLTELEHVLQALITIQITDFSDVDSLDLNVIIDNSSILLESAILQATISKQVLDLGTDVVTVPYLDEDELDVRVTVGNVLALTDTEYILKTEITAILEALTVLGVDDINNFSGDVDMVAITSDPNNINTLLASATIHATISKQLLELDTSGTIAVPYVQEDNLTDVRITVGTLGFETEYISKVEIKAMIDVLNILGITDNIDTFDGNVDMASIMSDPLNIDTLLLSSTIQATISQQLLDLETSGTLAIPYVEDDDTTPIRVTVGGLGHETEYIMAAEIRAMIDALEVLGITEDINSFDGNVDIASITSDPANIDILLTSATIQATISKQLIDLETSGTLAVPYVKDDNFTPVRSTVGVVGFETEYLSKNEIKALVDALTILGITDDINSFDGNVDIASITQDPSNIAVLLTSSTIQATISKQLFDLEISGTLAVPYVQDDDTTLVRETVGVLGFETEYLSKDEITALVDALTILGITDDINSFDGNVDIASITADPTNITTLLMSATIQATISKQLIDLDIAGTLALPYVQDDNSTIVRETVGLAGFETEYLSKDEITALVDALTILGITDDINSFDGNVDIASITADPTNITTLLMSATIQATISKQLIDLDIAGTLALPYVKDDNLTVIRATVGLAGFETEYLSKDEITALVDALTILGITDDINTFDGNVDIASITSDPTNIDTLLLSSTIQATITSQMVELGDAGTLVVPYWEEAASSGGYTIANAVRILVGTGVTETEYLSKQEIKDLVDALDVLGLTEDIDTFDGGVDIASVMADPANIAIVLASATLQATISQQLLDLDVTETIDVPFLEEDDSTLVRVTVTDGINASTEYITASEIEAMFTALHTLGLTDDIENFGGSVDLGLLDTDGKIDDVVSSSILQATISTQVIDIGTTATVAFVVPYWDDDTVTAQAIRIQVGTTGQPDETNYVWSVEIKNIIKGMKILGITDVTTFNGDIDLTSFLEPGTDRDTLLSSLIMKATISQQLINLDDVDDVMIVPQKDIDTNDIRIETGTLGVDDNVYIIESEIRAMFDALNTLGLANINDFSGSIDLNNVYGDTNQNIILASAAMHATISDQILALDTGLPGSPVTVPDNDVASTSLKASVAGTEFLIKNEIKAMINGLEVLQITDVTSFSGEFNLNLLNENTYPGSQDALLSSATIHKTISDTMTGLGASVLIVPDYQEDKVTEVRHTAVATEFVVTNEVKFVIDALLAMGIGDLNITASIDSSVFFNDPATVLLSSSIQATFSDKMINGTNGALIVPDNFYGTVDELRISTSSVDYGNVIYIELTELNAIIDGLEEMGLDQIDFTLFGGSTFGAGTVLAADFGIVLQSESLQATISDSILASALDENDTYTVSSLIIPTTLRQAITVNAVSDEHIEKQELIQLLESLNALGFTDFGDSISGGSITGMTSGQLDEMFDSESIHLTIDSMLRTNVSLLIPVEAETTIASIANITSETEIRNLLDALNTLGQGDFVSASFDVSAILALDVGQRSTVAESMIVRNTLQSEVYTMAIAPIPLVTTPFRALTSADYMGADTGSFFTKAAFLEIVEHDYS